MTTLSREQIDGLRAQQYNATLVHVRRVHDGLCIMRVRPDAGIPDYRAGQHTSLGLGVWEPTVAGCTKEEQEAMETTCLVKQSYSITSSILSDDGELLRPEDEYYFEFYLVLVRDGDPRKPSLTSRLFRLEEGDRLYAHPEIVGNYTLDPVRSDQNVVFISTGTGEAPQNKMILELLRRDHGGRIASVVCARYAHDLAYLETHRQLEQIYPRYQYLTYTTREESNRGSKLHIQDLIRSGALEEGLGYDLDPSSTHLFLCGNRDMIGAPRRDSAGNVVYPQPTGVVELLEARGFTADEPGKPGNVHFEAYW